MKGVFAFCLFIVFFFSFQIGVVSFFINQTVQPDNIKERLSSSGVYQSVANSIQTFNLPADAKEEIKRVLPILKKELTETYLKKKVEGVIDGTDKWLSGQSNVRPQIELGDLKEKIYQNLSGESVPPDLEKSLSDPLTLETNPTVEKIRQFFPLFQNSYLIAFLFSLASLLGIYFLAKSRKSAFRGVSLALFLASVSGILTSAVVLFSLSLGLNILVGSLVPSNFKELEQSIRAILNPILGSLSIGFLVSFLGGLGFSLFTLIGALLIKEKASA